MPLNQSALFFRDFLKKIIFLTLVLFAVYSILIFFVPGKYISQAIPAIIVFFFLLNVSVFNFQLNASLKKTSKFVNFFLVATTLKLMLILCIVLIYSLLNKPDAVNFILSFFIIYAVYSIFEVLQMLKLQDKLGPKNLQNNLPGKGNWETK